ncbi:EF-hand calcium-binding domain-containing protein 14 [Protopterus annectens]|uniref:EF-hand calcium-binding domain-containing protein 14 n=1 Tax=Protopterus annectens TaxID=7888 RepID=UPI001CF9A24A|nr:EF-hand calcium-binding domain-containing protein 14 [Protopterus annectens]
MKKRKELNALIGLTGDGRRKKPKKGSGHRLLRTEPPASDSESSSDEEDEFIHSGMHGLFGKGGYLRCCKIFYPLCAFVVLAACVAACVGLVWMQVALKEDLDALKEKLRTMESNQQSSSHEIHKLNEDLLKKQKQLESIETGDSSLSSVWTNVTELSKQISSLNSSVNFLKANTKSASDLKSLLNTVEELQKSVATIGSTLTSVQHAVETMQAAMEEQKGAAEVLQKQVGSLHIHEAIDEMNATVVISQKQTELRIFSLDVAIGNLTQRVTSVENGLSLISSSSKSDTSLNTSLNQNDMDYQDAELKEKLQLFSALADQPSGEKIHNGLHTDDAPQPFTEKPTTARLLFKSDSKAVKRSTLLKHVTLPGITRKEDLEVLFQSSKKGLFGELSYKDLEDIFGTALPKLQELSPFDKNGDGKFSLKELTAAIGL